MDADIKLMLGHLLGQILRLQEMVKLRSSGMDEAMRYKLILGFEDEIAKYFDRSVLGVSRESCSKAVAILSEIWRDPRQSENVNECSLKERFRRAGIPEGEYHVILTAIRLESRFEDLFRKIDPDGRRYQPTEWDI